VEGNDPIPGWMYVAATKVAHEVKTVSDGEIELDETALAAMMFAEQQDYEEFFTDDDPDGGNVVPMGGLMPTPEVMSNG